MKPLITCSIICYNYGRYLDQAIQSCLDQTLDRSLFEILIIDDGSTDNTPEVCARYADVVRISRTENMGFPKSLGRAVEEAHGEYVVLLDADDYFEKTKLQSVYEAIQADVAFVVNDHFIVDENNQTTGQGKGGQTSTLAFRRDRAVHLLPVTNELFFHIIGHAFSRRSVDAQLTYYRVHSQSMTIRGSFRHAAYFADCFQACHQRCLEMINAPGWSGSRAQLLKLAAHWRTEEIRERINQQIAAGNRPSAIQHSLRSLLCVFDEGPQAVTRNYRTLVRGLLFGLGLHWRYGRPQQA